MTKKIFILYIVLLLAFSSINMGYSEETPSQFIKIGLKNPVKQQDQITLRASNGVQLGLWQDGFHELALLDVKSIDARLDSYYSLENGQYKLQESSVTSKWGPIHIELESEFNTYREAVIESDKLKELGIDAFPAYVEGTFKVWVGSYTERSEAEDAFQKLINSTKPVTIIHDSKERIILESHMGILLAYDRSEPILIGSTNDNGESVIEVGDYTYRDYIAFNAREHQLITINYVELNHYLYGVVPREMSVGWPIEALKAQAVAARNYVLVNKNKHSQLGYDLCDAQDCQVYGGYNWEDPRTNKAVDETHDQIITYSNQPIYAYYHSSSGGHTENSENVWSSAVPYLRGVDDAFSEGSPNANWQLVLEQDNIKEKLSENNIEVGEIVSIEPMSYSQFGRVLELLIKGTEGTEILEKEKVRQIFGYGYMKSTWYRVNTDADVYILSADSLGPEKTTLNQVAIISEDGIEKTSRNYNGRFKISNGNQAYDIPVSPTSYIFSGKGWGHGLGMSQWGAKKMAELGYNYKEILEYYYTGAKVE